MSEKKSSGEKIKAYLTDIKEFHPDPSNANRHTLRGRSMVEKGMEQRGYARPAFAAKDGTVLGGNLSTMEVAPGIGLGDGKVFVVESDGTIPIIHKRVDVEAGSNEARLLAIEDNRTGEISLDWSPVQLAAELEAGLDLSQLWDDTELAAILEAAGTELLGGNGKEAPEPEQLIDKAEELQKKWQCQPGQLWQFESLKTPGRFHRLLIGDCRNPDDLARLCDGQKVNGVFTSPPYAEQRKKQYGGVPTAGYVEWWEAVQAGVRTWLADDGSFFVNIKPHCEDGQRVLYVFDLVLAMARRWGWRYVDELCWRDTKNGVPGKWPNRLKDAFEPVYQFSRSATIKFYPDSVGHNSDAVFDYSPLSSKTGTGSGFTGGYKHGGYKFGVALPSNVLDIPASSDNNHAAAFPLALPTFFIRAYSDPGDIWLDPFCGSGTTIAAAENEGRIGFGTEILPKYGAVICERLQATGLQPQLVSG